MRIDEKAAARLLEGQDDYLILTHGHPDGDTLGCALRSAAGCKNVANARAWNARMRSPQNLATLWREWSKRRLAPAFLWL